MTQHDKFIPCSHQNGPPKQIMEKSSVCHKIHTLDLHDGYLLWSYSPRSVSYLKSESVTLKTAWTYGLANSYGSEKENMKMSKDGSCRSTNTEWKPGIFSVFHFFLRFKIVYKAEYHWGKHSSESITIKPPPMGTMSSCFFFKSKCSSCYFRNTEYRLVKNKRKKSKPYAGFGILGITEKENGIKY